MMTAERPVSPGASAPLRARIRFVVELARRLHEYGTAAPRIEDALSRVSRRLRLACSVLSTPTSIVMSFSDDEDAEGYEITQIVRVAPGEVNLKHLIQVDAIGVEVVEGRLGLAEGLARLRAIGSVRPTGGRRALLVASFGVSAASIATVLHTSWGGVVTAGLIGLLIGLINLAAAKRPNLSAAVEALSAAVATLIATLIAVYVTPLALELVVIASLIVLMPGMTLTTAVRELSSQHLVSGAARSMGALATLLKLAFGTVLATQLCVLVGWLPDAAALAPSVPAWTEWFAVPIGAVAFAVIFNTPLRYSGVVVAAIVAGFLCAQLGGMYVSSAFGVFVGGLIIGAGSNLFARASKLPGVLVREPGIVLMVPGSVGFRTLSFVFERNVPLGADTAISLITLLVAIVAGLLIGDLLVPQRRGV